MEPEQETVEQEAAEQETAEEQQKRHWSVGLLFNNRISASKYVLRTGVISVVPSLIIAWTLAVVGVITEESGPEFKGPAVVLLITMIIVAPVIETLLMVPVLWVLSFITKRKVWLALMCAIVWAGLHSLAAPVWGLVVFWPWFVFSCSYLAWRERGWWRAFFITACVHAFHNILPAIAAVLTSTSMDRPRGVTGTAFSYFFEEFFKLGF